MDRVARLPLPGEPVAGDSLATVPGGKGCEPRGRGPGLRRPELIAFALRSGE